MLCWESLYIVPVDMLSSEGTYIVPVEKMSWESLYCPSGNGILGLYVVPDEISS